MSTTLQPVLACDESVATDISVFLSQSKSTYDVYIGVALLERVPTDPNDLFHKLLVARLKNAGVSYRELMESFGHDYRTIKKWAEGLLSGDIDEMARVFAGRSARKKVTPELIRHARRLYRRFRHEEKNYREIVIEEIRYVFGVTISTTIASALFKGADDEDADAENGGKVVNGEQETPELSTETAGSVNQCTTPLPAQTDSHRTGAEEMIHHAGQVLFADQMKTISDPLQRQVVGQVLQGAVNVEQSKTICDSSLAHFTGPVVQGLTDQRRALDGQSSAETTHQLYELNAGLLHDGPESGDKFYFDPHTKEYTGQLKTLKGWCGRRHSIAKVVNLDCFHTLSGRPCYIQHYSPYYDMRERFFMSLESFDRLFCEAGRRGRTFIIDRAIYSLPVLQAFGDDYFITWEKGYKDDGWNDDAPALAFTRGRSRNRNDDQVHVRFEYQESRWRRERSFRRIIVRATSAKGKTIEVSIITSNPFLDAQDVIWFIFRRWVQENDFKYLDTHFGINQLTSRDSTSFSERLDEFDDRPAESPEYRELKRMLGKYEKQLGKLLVDLRKNEKEHKELTVSREILKARRQKLIPKLEQALARIQNDKLSPFAAIPAREEHKELDKSLRSIGKKLTANRKKNAKLSGRAAELEAEIEPLEEQLCEAVRKQSRLQLLLDGNFRLIDTRKKAFMDGLRVIASNVFRNVHEKFRLIYNNYRDDHVLVRTLSRCSGSLTKTEKATIVKLWLPGRFQPYQVRAFEKLIRQVQDEINTNIGVEAPVEISLVSGPFRP